MLYTYTSLRIADNSGGFVGLCIQVLGQNKRGTAGDAIAMAIKTIILNRKVVVRRKRKVLKGTVRRAIVVRIPYYRRRFFNIFLRGSSNAVAILGNWGLPLATRIYGPAYFELKRSKFPKFTNIAEGVI